MGNVYQLKVHFGDTDAAGIVFYPNFYRWMDQATHEFFYVKYMSTAQLQRKENIILPLLEAHCKFKKPLFFEDKVDMHSSITDVQGKVFKIEHEFKKNNLLIAKGYEIRAWAYNGEDGVKAVKIPDHVRDLFAMNKESV